MPKWVHKVHRIEFISAGLRRSTLILASDPPSSRPDLGPDSSSGKGRSPRGYPRSDVQPTAWAAPPKHDGGQPMATAVVTALGAILGGRKPQMRLSLNEHFDEERAGLQHCKGMGRE